MEPFNTKLYEYMDRFEIFHQLQSLINQNIETQFTEEKNTTKHFFLTDLCNPASAYWARVGKPIEKSPELMAKLNQGTLLHNLFENKIKNFEGVVETEVPLDGAMVNVPGVKGRIDVVINNNIYIELKTKEELPKNIEDVLENYPHDIEQVAFYSALSCEKQTYNYLVFMKDSEPYDIKVFKIKLIDKGLIQNKIKERIKLLDKAIEDKNPSILGQCRYFKKSCQNKSECKCNELEILSIEYFKKSLEINEDFEYKDKIREIMKTEEKFEFYHNNVLNPRQYYLRNKTQFEMAKFDNSLKNTWEPIIKQAVFKMNYNLNLDEKKMIVANQINENLRIGFNWVKLPKTGKDNGDFLPYLVKISSSEYDKFLDNPNEYNVADLASIVGNYKNVESGLLINYYPKLKILKVFKIYFKNIRNLRKDITGICNQLKQLEYKPEEFELLELPPCPKFFNLKKDCPLTKICHKEEGKGCLD